MRGIRRFTCVAAVILLVGGAGFLASGHLLIVTRAASSVDPAPAVYTFQGRVYEGQAPLEPPLVAPLQGVTVELYGSQNAHVPEQLIATTMTNSAGWYGLGVPSDHTS